jgi:hypothetical protein
LQVAGVALRESRKFLPGVHLPPGFGAVNLSLPRATKEAFACLHSVFSQLPFDKRGGDFGEKLAKGDFLVAFKNFFMNAYSKNGLVAMPGVFFHFFDSSACSAVRVFNL